MYMGVGLCVEGGIGKAEQGMVRMDYAGRGYRKGRTGNGNGSLPLTALISSRDVTICMISSLESTCHTGRSSVIHR
jgi:hypothetical protein